VLWIELVTLITPIVLIVIFNILTFVKLKEKAAKIKRTTKPVKSIDKVFRKLNNHILSNSDTCLPDQGKKQNSLNELAANSDEFIHSNRSFNMKYGNKFFICILSIHLFFLLRYVKTENKNDTDIKDYVKPVIKRDLESNLIRRHKNFDYFRRKLTKERKAFLCLSSISFGLISSWLMFLIIWPMRSWCNSCISELLFSIGVWINYSSSTANPLILLIFHSKFQAEICIIFSDIYMMLRRYIHRIFRHNLFG